MTDEQIRGRFEGASDFETRTLRSGEERIHAYFIDGLVSSGFVADYIFKPIVLDLPGDLRKAYDAAVNGGIYNAVARPVKDLEDAASKQMEIPPEDQIPRDSVSTGGRPCF